MPEKNRRKTGKIGKSATTVVVGVNRVLNLVVEADGLPAAVEGDVVLLPVCVFAAEEGGKGGVGGGVEIGAVLAYSVSSQLHAGSFTSCPSLVLHLPYTRPLTRGSFWSRSMPAATASACCCGPGPQP